MNQRVLAICLIIGLIIGLFPLIATAQSGTNPSRNVLTLDIDGPITAGQSTFVQRQIKEADPDEIEAILILLNTPGGLLDATLKMVQAFEQTSIPIVIFVSPSGAIAASAGAFILVAADIAAMTPGTAVGAAMPITLSPEGAQDADEKTINLFASQMRAIAEEKGRPGDIAERFVTENLSLDARQAEEDGIIDLLATGPADLLSQIDGWEGEKQGIPYRLSTDDASLAPAEMNTRERFQDVVSDPQIAFLLFMAGGLGIYFGLGMPGTLVPETIGAILLILGIYGIGMFDTNTTGIILLLLGFGLIVAELFTGGFGILGVGGGISLLFGAILLPHEPFMAADWYATFRSTAIGVAIAIVALSALIVTLVIQSRRRWKDSGDFFRPAERATVVNDLDPFGSVKMRGEIWSAETADGSTIPRGTTVQVLEQEGLTLIVKIIDDSQNDANAGA